MTLPPFDPLFAIIGGVLLAGALLMLVVRGSRVSWEANALIEGNARCVVVKMMKAEDTHGEKTLCPTDQFSLIRRTEDIIICRDYYRGDVFYITVKQYMMAFQEGRFKEYHG